ncbi:beta clamp domain-containing protein [Spirosoma sordidisoli]|uniref:Beta sliding clamp n=1 Tax=Spirosoma sordidisoli TaxID=2502893 RepID=A0A4Q2UPU5_9BACT|nr:hypothetical protein [Spirosoma sordidisoli]RYC69655.1 hypothetical protein EQG79_13725 [Spirosoma sordidisoli]
MPIAIQTQCLTINSEKLRSALVPFSKIIKDNPAIPVHASVLIQVDGFADTYIQIVGASDIMRRVVQLPIDETDSQDAFACCIEYHPLVRVLASMTSQPITIDYDGTSAKLTSLHGTVTLPAYPARDFTNPNTVDRESLTFTVPADMTYALGEAIKRAKAYTINDALRPEFSGVWLSPDPESGGCRVDAVNTEICYYEYVDSIEVPGTFLIPGYALPALMPLLKWEMEVVIQVGKWIHFEAGGETISVRQMEHSPYNPTQIWDYFYANQENDITMVGSKDLLENMLLRIKTLPADHHDGDHIVAWENQKDMTYHYSDYHAEEIMPVTYEGPLNSRPKGFRASRLLAALSAFEGEVQLQTQSDAPGRAVFITFSKPKTKTMAMIMPIVLTGR